MNLEKIKVKPRWIEIEFVNSLNSARRIKCQTGKRLFRMREKPFILVVEDNPGDVRLIREALKESSIQATLYVLGDGSTAVRFLDESRQAPFQALPSLVLLDLNLPRKGGHEVLQHIKSDDRLKRIPVIVFSSSQDPADVNKAYDLHANCYLNKPVDLEPFNNVVKAIEYFWLKMAKLPSLSNSC